MFKKYVHEVSAIQWDGTEEMLSLLKSLVDTELVRMWMVDGTGEYSHLKNSLRLNYKNYQGDPWVCVGDYLILIEKSDRFFHYTKEQFEAIFVEKK